MPTPDKTSGALLAEEQLADPSFRAEWQRLAPAREFAAALLRYRAEHELSQRALAKKLGVSQPAVRKPALVTARAQKRGAIAHDGVSVVAASSV